MTPDWVEKWQKLTDAQRDKLVSVHVFEIHSFVVSNCSSNINQAFAVVEGMRKLHNRYVTIIGNSFDAYDVKFRDHYHIESGPSEYYRSSKLAEAICICALYTLGVTLEEAE